MSSIFIIGATGFIGLPAATALRRAGYLVYGHARSPERARLLAQNEIIPLQGDVKDLASWLPPTIETVIDISGLYSEAVTVLEECKKMGGGRKSTDPKLGYIYTSGIWVHGSSATHVSEATPLNRHTPCPSLVAWRPEVENQVLASRDILDAVIIRPALLYGGNGTIWNIFLDPIFDAARSGAETVQCFGAPTTPITLVHKDDLADVYVKVVDKLTVLAASTYPVIDAASHREDLGSVLAAFAAAVGFKGEVRYRAPETPYDEAMVTITDSKPHKAMGLLGWIPRQIGFAQGMQIYAASYAAYKG